MLTSRNRAFDVAFRKACRAKDPAQPDALILRRRYPALVTLADLRAAHAAFWHCVMPRKVASSESHEMYTRIRWTAALKQVTGAIDEVHAVVDGREVRVAVAKDTGAFAYSGCWADIVKSHEYISDLLNKADRENYWARPHEVRLELQRREP